MTAETKESDVLMTNGAMDIAKLIMAVLVIGIHTEPFGFNFMLDKGFGICTRLCVPFFFVASAYFYWLKEKSIKLFLQRIILLYAVWSIIYLPFDIRDFRQMPALDILHLFLWEGNLHGLWYLWATVIGFGIVYFLLKFLKPEHVLIIAAGLLIAGTLKSTYSTAVYQIFGVGLPDRLGSRNGLFYGAAYIALGMVIAKSDTKGIVRSKKKLYAGFVISMLLLAGESLLFVMHFKAGSTILWLSVFPGTYFLFEIVLNSRIRIPRTLSLVFRKTSTLMYVSQFLFILPLRKFVSYVPLFVLTVLATAVFSFMIIKLSEAKSLHFLKYLY